MASHEDFARITAGTGRLNGQRNRVVPAFERIAETLKISKLTRNFYLDCSSPTSKQLMELIIMPMFHSSVLPDFKALVPRCTYQAITSEGSGFQEDYRKPTVVQVFLLSYAALNNLVGTKSKVNFQMFSEYLDDIIVINAQNALTRPAQELRLQLSVWRGMAETALRAAIESGNCDVVEKLFSFPQLGLDIDGWIYSSRGYQKTLISRSAELQHLDMVKLLLHLGADVNKRHNMHSYRSALEYALEVFRPWCRQGRSQNLDLVHQLLEAGAMITASTFHGLVDARNVDLLKLLLGHPSSGANNALLNPNIFYTIQNFLDEQDVIWFLRQVRAMGCADILLQEREESYYDSYPGLDPVPAPLDVAIQRRHLDVLHYLLDMGAKFTSDTLVVAIESRNHELCDFLLVNGVKTDCFSPTFGTTPLAEALRTDQRKIVAKLSPSNFIEKITDNKSCCATLHAVVEVGHDDKLRCLLQSHILGYLKADCFLTALCTAIEFGNSPLAIMLLEFQRTLGQEQFAAEHGSYIYDCCSRCSRQDSTRKLDPLISGLKQQDFSLVDALLEHGFGWAMNRLGSQSTIPEHLLAMELATQSENLHIMRELHDRGNVLGQSLQIALRMQNMNCVRLLLCLREASVESYGETVLQQAALHGDEGLLCELLDCGIDPRDSHALTVAVSKTSNAQRILTDAVAAILPRRRSWRLGFSFASAALASAIAWDREERMRDLLDLNVPIDMCTLRCAYLNRSEPKSASLVGDQVCFRLGYNSEYDIAPFPWSSLTGDETSSFTLGNVWSPLAVAVFKDGDEDCRVLREILEVGMQQNIDMNSAVLFSSFESEAFNSRSRSKLTALMLAISAKRIDRVQLILDFGADINTPATGGFKRTPLQKAAEIGSWAIVELLVSKGADVNAVPSVRGGATALQLASIGGFSGIAELLIDNGADILAPGAKVYGRTAIEGAAEHGRYDVVQLLAQHAQHPNSRLERAAEYATKHGHKGVVDLLRELIEENKMPTTNKTPAQRRHACIDCGRSFVRAYTLNRHRAAVHNVAKRTQAFQCDVCLRSFSRKDILTRHRETHTGQAHVTCPSCGDQYSRSDYLSVHLKKCQQYGIGSSRIGEGDLEMDDEGL